MKYREVPMRVVTFLVYLISIVSIAIPVESFGQLTDANAPEWPLRIPRYQRQKGGFGDFIYDRKHDGLLFNGGAYDTYYTKDLGASWRMVFDTIMYNADVKSQWAISNQGTWYYYGKIYLRWGVNCISTDEGVSLNYLFTPEQVPLGTYLKQPLAEYLNDGVVCVSGYTSCDDGKSWGVYTYDSDMFSPRPGYVRRTTTRVTDSTDWSSFYYVALETKACDTVVERELPFGKYYPAKYFWMNGERYYCYKYMNTLFRRSYPGGVVDSITQGVDNSGKMIPLDSIENFHKIDDDRLLITTTTGDVYAYRCASHSLVALAVPEQRHTALQLSQVAIGKDHILVQQVIPIGYPGRSDRWTCYTMSTGEIKSYQRSGEASIVDYNELPTEVFTSSTVFPLTDSMWIMSLQTTPGEQALTWGSGNFTVKSPSATTGELVRTTNAGLTWDYVADLPRDNTWDSTYVNFTRVFARPGTKPSFMTNTGRILNYDERRDKWSIALIDPFVYSLRYSPYDTTSPLIYATDFDGRRRLRFGEPTAFYHSKDTVWTTGDAVLRWTSDGKFIDTVMQRNSQKIGRLSPSMIFAGDDSTWISFNNGKEWFFVSRDWPKYQDSQRTVLPGLGDMIQADNGTLIAGLRGIQMDTDTLIYDSIPGGILRSLDMGNTWQEVYDIPQGYYVSSLAKLPSGTLLALAVDLVCWPGAFRDPVKEGGEYYRKEIDFLTLKEFQVNESYIYRSSDNGMSWYRVHIFPRRGSLPEADMRLVVSPDGNSYAINPEYGIIKSTDDGKTFRTVDPWFLGNRVINDILFDESGDAHICTTDGYAIVKKENLVTVYQDVTVTTGDLAVRAESDGMLYVISDDRPSQVQVFGIDGKLLLEKTSADGVEVIDISTMPNGAYIVRAMVHGLPKSALIGIAR